MKKIVFALGMFLLFFGTSMAALSIAEYTVSKSSYAPGEEGYITVTIENTEASGTDYSSVTVQLQNPPEIKSYTSYQIGDLESSAQTVITVPFTLSENASDGVYTMRMTVFGYETTSTGSRTINTKTALIPIYVVNEPNLEISSTKNTITDLDTLPILIKNNGGVARKLSIRLGGDFALFGTNQIFINSLTDRTSVEVPIDSRDSEEGAVSIPFIIEYENALGTQTNSTKYLRITLKKDALDLGFTQKSEIIIRKDSTINLVVRNNGERLENVRFSFGTQNIRLKNLQEISVGDLASNQEVPVNAQVFADLPPGINQVPVVVKWIESDVEKEETLSVPLTITSDADVNVFLDAKPSPLTSGSEHTLSVLVSNLGSYGIDTVDVKIGSEALELLDVSNIKYIGSLEKDDFSTVQFKVRVGEAIKAGEYPLTINVDYKDRSGEQKTKELIRTIQIHSPSNTSEGGILPLVFIVLLAGGAVWYFKFRKK